MSIWHNSTSQSPRMRTSNEKLLGNSLVKRFQIFSRLIYRFGTNWINVGIETLLIVVVVKYVVSFHVVLMGEMQESVLQIDM